MLLDRVPATLLAASDLRNLDLLGDSALDTKIREAVDKAGRQEKRRRRLSPRLMVYLVLSMSLYRTLSIPNVFKELLKGLRNLPLLRWPPASSALTDARYGLGFEPLRELFGLTASTVSPPATFHGHRVRLIDGVRVSVADTPENEEAFGRPTASRGQTARPIVRIVARAAAYSHRVEKIDIDRWDAPEHNAVEALIGDLDNQDLVILDRLYASGDLFNLFRERGVMVLARINSQWNPRIVKTLGVGDCIVEVAVSRPIDPAEAPVEKRNGRPRKSMTTWLQLRMLTYSTGKEISRLLTSLPSHIPALDIAKLYHQRWEIELTNDEFKTHFASALQGSEPLCFRSKIPTGVLQEVYGMFVAYNSVRDIIGSAAAAHDLRPTDISFTDALNAIRRILPFLQTATPVQRQDLTKELYHEIATYCRLRPRRARQYPRVVKVKMSNFQCKKPWDAQTKIDYLALTKMVNPAPGLVERA